MTVAEELARLNPSDEHYAARFVERLLRAAIEARASDVHIQPTAEALQVRWRLDGVLHPVGTFPRGRLSDVVTRLKVLAGLLTYRTEVPQEGRIRLPSVGFQSGDVSSIGKNAGVDKNAAVDTGPEMRVSTFPTIFGERAVIRFFPRELRWQRVAELGLPAEAATFLEQCLAHSSGSIIISGPAGSGKTTTAYACLSELATRDGGGRNLVTLEDPVEVVLPGVSQSQIASDAGFDFASGLRSLMRQDPDVILIGEMRDRATVEAAFNAALTGHLVITTFHAGSEMRDRATVEAAFNAALTGHLVITTFHAGSAVEAITRLNEMGLEPYLVRSALRAVFCQRLLRVLCDCAQPSTDPLHRAGLPLERVRTTAGCPQCFHSGYRGRRVLAEWVDADHPDLAPLILHRSDTRALAAAARQAGFPTLWQQAVEAARQGWTSPQEVRRVLGSDSSRYSGGEDNSNNDHT